MSATKDLAIQIMNDEFGLSQGEQHELLNWSKSDITERAKAIVLPVAEGYGDPVKDYLKVRKGLDFFTEAEKNLKPYFNAVQLNKGEKYFGCEIVEKEVGVKYDFSECNDPEYNALCEQFVKLQGKIKSRENFLKSLTEPMHCFDDQSGETWTVHPPIKSGQLSKTVSIK